MAEIVETRTDEASGREYYVYDNGGEHWKDSGKLKKPPPEYLLTSERGRELVARRYELAQQKALEGIDEAAIEAGKLPAVGSVGGDGWKVIVKHVAKTLLESKNLRGQAEAANFLGKAAGFAVPEEQTPENIAVAIAHLFEKFLDRLPADRPETIEGKFK
jgi:hypothetical protein